MLKRAVVVALCAVAGSAAAGDVQTPFYVKGGLGYGWATDAGIQNRAETGTPQIAGTLEDVGQSAVYELGAGWQLAPAVRAELSYQYRDGFKLSDKDVGAGACCSYSSKIKSQALFVTGFYDFPAIQAVTPFVGVGVGVSQNKMDALNYSGSVTGAGAGGKKSSVAWQLIAGGSITVQKNLALDVAYRYVDLGKVKTDKGMNVDTLGTYPSDGIGGKLRSNELSLSLRQSF